MVVLEEQVLPGAILDGGSTGRKGRAYITLVFYFKNI
jgi:hypothetical protein